MMNARRAGFTLIEILVVLSILALVMTFGVPRVMSFYEKYQRKLVFDQVERGFKDLPIKVFARNKDAVFLETKDFRKYIDLDEGIILKAETPLKVRRDGFCSGGEVFLTYKEKRYFLEPTPPYCELLNDPQEVESP